MRSSKVLQNEFQTLSNVHIDTCLYELLKFYRKIQHLFGVIRGNRLSKEKQQFMKYRSSHSGVNFQINNASKLRLYVDLTYTVEICFFKTGSSGYLTAELH